MSANAITVSGLAFRYFSAKNWAIDGLSLEVAERELLGISGPSGAGKSTLCLSLSGLIPNVVEGTMRGTVNVRGIDTRERDVADITSIVGVVFQDPRSQLTGSAMTVEEEVAFGLQNMGVPRGLMRERIAEALGLVGLSGFEMRIPFELSGGEQQRLSLATVIAMRPQILILDEPTELLDPEGAVSVMRAVRSAHEKYQMTTVLVSNQPEILVRHAERIAVLDGGKVVFIGTPQEFLMKVRYLERLGVRSSQVAQLACQLDERGLWKGDYPMDERQAAAMIRRQYLGD
jgi:energy-coupling factor transport system ATP-binding protein